MMTQTQIARIKFRLEDQKRLGLDAAGYDRYLQERAKRIARESRLLWARDIAGTIQSKQGLTIDEIRSSEEAIVNADYDVEIGVENAKVRGF